MELRNIKRGIIGTLGGLALVTASTAGAVAATTDIETVTTQIVTAAPSTTAPAELPVATVAEATASTETGSTVETALPNPYATQVGAQMFMVGMGAIALVGGGMLLTRQANRRDINAE